MTDFIIKAHSLVKHYGAILALAGFDLRVPRGSRRVAMRPGLTPVALSRIL